MITKRDKNINDEVPGNGLLLTASDAFNWKECLINKFVKWGCVSILDTYPAEASQLKKEFVERLKTESTPKKALQNQEEKEKIPVAQPVDRSRFHRFTASDLRQVSAKVVFTNRERYLDS